MRNVDRMIKHLREKFPDSAGFSEKDIRWFLTYPNGYIGDKLPINVKKIDRLYSLFDRFLHPADVF